MPNNQLSVPKAIIASLLVSLPFVPTVLAQATSHRTTTAAVGDGPGLFVEFGGGAVLPTNKTGLATATDLDKPLDLVASSPQFDGSLGTSLYVGMGVELSNDIAFGVEGYLSGHNVDDDNVVVGSTSYDIDATASSLGVLFTTEYQWNVADGLAIEPMLGVGYFTNTADGTLKSTTGGVTTTDDYQEHTRYGLGYALGLGLSYEISDTARFGAQYRYQSSADASTGYKTGQTSGNVIDFGTLEAHHFVANAGFKF